MDGLSQVKAFVRARELQGMIEDEIIEDRGLSMPHLSYSQSYRSFYSMNMRNF